MKINKKNLKLIHTKVDGELVFSLFDYLKATQNSLTVQEGRDLLGISLDEKDNKDKDLLSVFVPKFQLEYLLSKNEEFDKLGLILEAKIIVFGSGITQYLGVFLSISKKKGICVKGRFLILGEIKHNSINEGVPYLLSEEEIKEMKTIKILVKSKAISYSADDNYSPDIAVKSLLQEFLEGYKELYLSKCL